MPKVKPLVRPDPRERAIREEIGSIQGVLQINQAAMAKEIGMPNSTLSMRMKNIGTMRLSEYWAIQDMAKKAGYDRAIERVGS